MVGLRWERERVGRCLKRGMGKILFLEMVWGIEGVVGMVTLRACIRAER